MHSNIANRLRKSSITTAPPPKSSAEYSQSLSKLAGQIFYKSPLPSKNDLPVFVLNASAFPDSKEVNFDALLPYVLARLPAEDELIGGKGYEIVFFAGGSGESATATKKNRPGWGWFIQAYNVLSRATRKRLQKLYIVHETLWIRLLVEMFSTIVSPKFRKKIIHVSTLTSLAFHIPIEDLLIPVSAYLHDRQHVVHIDAPYVSGKRAFSARIPLPRSHSGQERLPRVLRETTRFILMEKNITTQGLFRVPPHAKLLDILHEAYDRAQKFIIWKEGDATLPQPSYSNYGRISEIEWKDGYGVHLAAGLIKYWYRKLSEPLIPESAYRELENVFGDESAGISPERLVDLLSPDSEWSCLPADSRDILRLHLLPLLSRISQHEEQNKMDAKNLAVCFAPALSCGVDPVRDVKISSIIRRVLEIAIEQWDKGLQEVCGTSFEKFESDLQDPVDVQDFEDPLRVGQSNIAFQHKNFSDSTVQLDGIALEDNDIVLGSSPPPLPPRPSGSPESTVRQPSDDASVRRKPAPPLAVPPRYSMAMQDGAHPSNLPHNQHIIEDDAATTESPTTYAATTDGFLGRQGSSDVNDQKRPSGVNQGKAFAQIPTQVRYHAD